MSNKPKLLISVRGDFPYAEVDFFIDGTHIASGSYGGEPEDNLRGRDYQWVEGAIAKIAIALGAEVELVIRDAGLK